MIHEGQVYKLNIDGCAMEHIALLAQADFLFMTPKSLMVLVALPSGHRFHSPVEVRDMDNISSDEFKELCNGWTATLLGDFDEVFKLKKRYRKTKDGL